jgi:ABC-type antimicrobial peptide transport system permease subunit
MGSFSIAVRDLRRRLLITSVTVLSITLAVSAFLCILPLAENFEIAVGAAMNLQMYAAEPHSMTKILYSFRQPNTPVASADAIRDLDGVSLVNLRTEFIAEDPGGFMKVNDTLLGEKLKGVYRRTMGKPISIFGIDPESEDAWWRASVTREGRGFSDFVTNGSYISVEGECMVGLGMVDRFFDLYQRFGIGNISVGDTLTIMPGMLATRGTTGGATHQEITLKVVGLFKTLRDPELARLERPEEGWSGNTLILHRTDAENLFRMNEDTVSRIYVRYDPDAQGSDLINNVIIPMRKMPEISPFFITPTGAGAMGSTRLAHTTTIIISFIAVAVVIMNMMFTRVYERVRDIGIMGSFGATIFRIMSIFMIQAIFLGIIGGILGVAVAFVASQLYPNLITLRFTIPLLVSPILLAVALSLVSSIIPAFRAALYDPLTAMRYGLEAASESVVTKYMNPIYKKLVKMQFLRKRIYSSLAIRNLLRRFTRSLLATIGIAIGIGLFVQLMITSQAIKSQIVVTIDDVATGVQIDEAAGTITLQLNEIRLQELDLRAHEIAESTAEVEGVETATGEGTVLVYKGGDLEGLRDRLLETKLRGEEMTVEAYQTGLALVAIAIGALGTFNTMITAVLERTGEIGAMVAIGGEPKHIRRMFRVEASIIGLIGGVIGAFIGLAAAMLPFLFTWNFEGLRWLTILSMMGLGVVLAIGISYTSSWYPSRRASGMAPAEAFRLEY